MEDAKEKAAVDTVVTAAESPTSANESALMRRRIGLLKEAKRWDDTIHTMLIAALGFPVRDNEDGSLWAIIGRADEKILFKLQLLLDGLDEVFRPAE